MEGSSAENDRCVYYKGKVIALYGVGGYHCGQKP